MKLYCQCTVDIVITKSIKISAGPTYFIRRAKKNKEDDRASQEQVIQSEISAQVMREVSLQHPIVSSSGYNICELMRMRKKKLVALSVDMLRSICDELGVGVSDITQRRKNPFISRLSKLVDECGCTSQAA